MRRTLLLASLCAAAATLAGCALSSLPAGADARAEPVYVTGSNIARRQAGSVTTLDREEAEREMTLRGNLPRPPSGAH